MKEKIIEYQKNCNTVVFLANPFCVGIFTPIMKRAHNLPNAKEIVFCDTTSSCDPQHHSVTFLLTTCPVGAAPLGVLITQGQSTEVYTAAFRLVKNNISNALANRGYPTTFITDNSKAEIDSLNSVWPESQHLLCIFHVLQAVWRWLWDSKNGIPSDQRQDLMTKFHRLLYCDNLANVDELYELCKENCAKLPQWLTYLDYYYGFKEKWIIAYRDHSIRGNHTNNYSEVNIRIFKDVVLSRVKVYNAIALIDFCVTALEKFYKSKLRAFCNFQNRSSLLFFRSQLRKVQYLSREDIVELTPGSLYLVPSEADRSICYTVDVLNACCTCKHNFGKFCKHQCAVYKYFDQVGSNLPEITPGDRYAMACLAFDPEERPPREFYDDYHCASMKTSNNNSIKFMEQRNVPEITSENNDENVPNNGQDICASGDKNVSDDNQDVSEINRNKLLDLCCIFMTKVDQYGSSETASNLKKFKKDIEGISSPGQLCTFLVGSHRYRTSFKQSTIKVQPTSIARHEPGITKGCKRLAYGQKATIDNSVSSRVSKVHRFTDRVRRNVS